MRVECGPAMRPFRFILRRVLRRGTQKKKDLYDRRTPTKMTPAFSPSFFGQKIDGSVASDPGRGMNNVLFLTVRHILYTWPDDLKMAGISGWAHFWGPRASGAPSRFSCPNLVFLFRWVEEMACFRHPRYWYVRAPNERPMESLVETINNLFSRQFSRVWKNCCRVERKMNGCQN